MNKQAVVELKKKFGNDVVFILSDRWWDLSSPSDWEICTRYNKFNIVDNELLCSVIMLTDITSNKLEQIINHAHVLQILYT